MIWQANAPSNIALIKYMGKTDHYRNLPINASLSYTLKDFRSTVSLEKHHLKHHTWQPLVAPTLQPIQLSLSASDRFLEHIEHIKKHMDANAHFFTVRSANNFPAACGLASSAASFAALTQATCDALSALDNTPVVNTLEQTALSRHGSGSSCRSFFPDWAMWDNEYACPVDLPFKTLIHRVIIIDEQEKQVSSSDAHRAVALSPYYAERATRANQRLEKLITAMHCQDWRQCYQIVWAEFIDMHELFSTANPSIHYINDDADTVLELLKNYWRKHKDGPLVTMDAGPNIHLLFRPDQDVALQTLTETLETQYKILGAQHDAPLN